MKRLLVAVIGNRNSGKSRTWNTLFGSTVRTGDQERDLSLGSGKSVSVFLVSGSPEERKQYVGKIVQGSPRIVLCSLQYTDGVFDSLRYFLDAGYFAFVHWLNPGYTDSGTEFDRLGLVPRLLAEDTLVGIRNGQVNPKSRVEEMRDFIRGWDASHRAR